MKSMKIQSTHFNLHVSPEIIYIISGFVDSNSTAEVPKDINSHLTLSTEGCC